MVLQEQTANMQNFDVLSGLYKNYSSVCLMFMHESPKKKKIKPTYI